MNEIRENILQKLKKTEEEHQIRILLALESGSRGWGFASPDSDYDCRFIYAGRKERYLSVFEKRDVIEYETDGIFDINGWDLKKALRYIVKSSAVIFEWLSSKDLYREEKTAAAELRLFSDGFFNADAVSRHYLGIVKKKIAELQHERESGLKKYFYILRPLANLEYIEQYGVMPPMDYRSTLERIEMDGEIRRQIGELLELKSRSGESSRIKVSPLLLSYINDRSDRFEKKLADVKPEITVDEEKTDALFRHLVEEAWKNENPA